MTGAGTLRFLGSIAVALGLIGLWQQLSNQVQAQTYSHAFILAGVLTLLGAGLAFFLPSGRPEPGDAPVAAH